MLAAALADNRRSAYRVRPIATDQLAIALRRDDQTHVPHEVADVTYRGASIRFLKDNAPAVAKGDEVTVEIDSPNLQGKASLNARIVFTGESTTERLIGLAFEQGDDLAQQGSDTFFQLFNRRGSYRGVDAVPAGDLRASVKPLETAHNNRTLYPVTVRNLSATGICLDVAKDADMFLRERVNVRLALRLPGHTGAKEIITTVCYRTSTGGKVYYGCQFDWSETSKAAEIMEDVTSYTLDRFDASVSGVGT